MTGTGFLLILIGIFVAINTTNIVGVLQGNKTIGQNKTPKTTVTTTPNSSSGPTSGGNATGGGGGGGGF